MRDALQIESAPNTVRIRYIPSFKLRAVILLEISHRNSVLGQTDGQHYNIRMSGSGICIFVGYIFWRNAGSGIAMVSHMLIMS